MIFIYVFVDVIVFVYVDVIVYVYVCMSVCVAIYLSFLRVKIINNTINKFINKIEWHELKNWFWNSNH